MTDFLRAANARSEQLAALRAEIHRHPEPGNAEYRTAALVERELHALGIETVRLTETAVMGTLRGALPGRTAALRADMDALPVTEQTGCPFASEVPGMMHACGHDVHTTAALGAAMLLSERRTGLHGTVRFLFEPDEEGSGGAARMIAAGAMDGADAAFGAHVDPALPEGTVGFRYGKFYAASDTFTITVRGKSAHGAQPERGIDALAAACSLSLGLRGIPASLSADRCVVTVGTLHGGTAGNIIADTAELKGIIRTLGPANRAAAEAAVRRHMAETDAAFGTHTDLALHRSYGGVVNTDAETALAEQAAIDLLGAAQVRRISEPLMTTEDFGCLIDAAAGCFYHIGAGCGEGLHASTFLPTHRALLTAAAVHAAVLARYLGLEEI